MRRSRVFSAALAASIAAWLGACSPSREADGANMTATPDGGITPPEEDASLDAPPDGPRALLCGDAGFCETRLPTSDLGLPLSLRGLWVVAKDDVWSVSVEGYVLHFDGAAWSVAHRAHHALFSVWATPTSVWAGGESGLLLHRGADGAWARVETGYLESVRSIVGRADDDVWFASLRDTLDHFDGQKLVSYPLGIPRIRMTTVFGKSGEGMYAAGYVSGEPAPQNGADPLQHLQPYVVELLPTGPAVFNAQLPERRGFVPLAGGVTESPGKGMTAFIGGYDYFSRHAIFKTGVFGRTDAINLRGWTRPGPGNRPVWNETRPIDPDVPPLLGSVWVRRSDDVVYAESLEAMSTYLLRWNGVEQGGSSIQMGDTFPIRLVFGLHGTETATWIVGDGFALQGGAL